MFYIYIYIFVDSINMVMSIICLYAFMNTFSLFELQLYFIK